MRERSSIQSPACSPRVVKGEDDDQTKAALFAKAGFDAGCRVPGGGVWCGQLHGGEAAGLSCAEAGSTVRALGRSWLLLHGSWRIVRRVSRRLVADRQSRGGIRKRELLRE